MGSHETRNKGSLQTLLSRPTQRAMLAVRDAPGQDPVWIRQGESGEQPTARAERPPLDRLPPLELDLDDPLIQEQTEDHVAEPDLSQIDTLPPEAVCWESASDELDDLDSAWELLEPAWDTSRPPPAVLPSHPPRASATGFQARDSAPPRSMSPQLDWLARDQLPPLRRSSPPEDLLTDQRLDSRQPGSRSEQPGATASSLRDLAPSRAATGQRSLPEACSTQVSAHPPSDTRRLLPHPAARPGRSATLPREDFDERLSLPPADPAGTPTSGSLGPWPEPTRTLPPDRLLPRDKAVSAGYSLSSREGVVVEEVVVQPRAWSSGPARRGAAGSSSSHASGRARKPPR